MTSQGTLEQPHLLLAAAFPEQSNGFSGSAAEPIPNCADRHRVDFSYRCRGGIELVRDLGQYLLNLERAHHHASVYGS